MEFIFKLVMFIYLNIILLPFILIRGLFLSITLGTAKTFSYLAYVPYVFLFGIDVFMVFVSFGYIDDIAYDFEAMQNMLKMY